MSRQGRKFAVVAMSMLLLAMGMATGFVAAYQGLDLDWLGLVLPILASTLPAYLGANAYQKGQQFKAGSAIPQPAQQEKYGDMA